MLVIENWASSMKLYDNDVDPEMCVCIFNGAYFMRISELHAIGACNGISTGTNHSAEDDSSRLKWLNWIWEDFIMELDTKIYAYAYFPCCQRLAHHSHSEWNIWNSLSKNTC